MRAAVRLFAVALLTAIMYLAYLVRRIPLRRPADRYPVVQAWTSSWSRAICWLSGIELEWDGRQVERGTLITPNHTGYLDIIVLSAVFPCFFVSKAEAADWPVVGLLLRASEQVLVSRRRSHDLSITANAIRGRLENNASVVVFLEGTTSGGDRLLRFHPSLLQPAIDARASATPVGLRWSGRDPRMKVSEDIAYWKDHVFATHVWRLLGLRGARVQIRTGRPFQADGQDRKQWSQLLHSEVAKLAGLQENRPTDNLIDPTVPDAARPG